MKKSFVTLLLLSLLTSCGGGRSETQNDEWRVGGTLHNSSLQTWISSTEQNKLATCADFVSNVKNYEGNISKMKADATEVMKCIDESAKEQYLSGQKTNEIAALCVLLLGVAQ
jgi:hypothetical protein